MTKETIIEKQKKSFKNKYANNIKIFLKKKKKKSKKRPEKDIKIQLKNKMKKNCNKNLSEEQKKKLGVND